MKHTVCRWTFNAGKGGFVPADMRPLWEGMSTAEFVELVAKAIKPRVPKGVELGIEVHYDNEINERMAADVVKALKRNGMYLGLITPGAHGHWGYGGIASLDPKERKGAEAFGVRTVDLAYGAMKPAWHPKAAPSFVLWNGSWGYDIPGPWLMQMLQNVEDSLVGLLRYEKKKGGKLFVAIEPKPNEGHPKMILPTVASALLMGNRVAAKAGTSKLGTNKEFGHSEMIGLDAVYDTAEELREGSLFHVHANSQGYDGIRAGGPGMFDVDHGVGITGSNIAIARLLIDAGYERWIGHDMQPRAYDDEKQATERVVRSIISWEAMVKAAKQLKMNAMMKALANRDTATVEDAMGDAICAARKFAADML